MSVANPKKTKKPKTSVAVVIKMVAEVAGSFPIAFINSGINAPKKPAMTKLHTIATPITKPSAGL